MYNCFFHNIVNKVIIINKLEEVEIKLNKLNLFKLA